MTEPMPEPRPLVWFIPERPGRMVTMHACWGADFNGSTAVFPTEAEAVAFQGPARGPAQGPARQPNLESLGPSTRE